MKTLDFCGGWQVGYLEGDLREPVTLPHDAMLREKRTQGSAGDVHIGWFEGHNYEYVKCFAASDEMLSGHALVEFEGVYHNAQVYINDVLVAERPYGYSGFYADMTGHLKRCENVLRVLVKNKEQPNSRWYTGSGIYRPVWLHLMPPAHILPHGVRVMTTDYLSRSIRVDIQTSTSGTVKIEFLDGGRVLHSDEKQTQGALSLSYTLPDMELWSPETPNRYLCRVRFGQDEQKVCFGVRAVQCDARNGLRINGERTVLRGACVHHDNGLLGACAYAHAERRKVRLLKEAGFNAIRSAHNPCSRAMLEACDEMGMLVMDELADCWYIHKTRYDYATHYDTWWREDLRAMVEKDYNHPSVVMYCLGNEVSETAQKRGIALTGRMAETLRAFDRSRPVVCSINIFFNLLSSLGLGVYSDKKAEKASKKKKHRAVGSEFINHVAGLFGGKAMKLGATLYGCDRKCREAYALVDVAGYNYGDLRYLRDIRRYPDRVIVGSETFCKDACSNIRMAQKYPAIIGDFVWTGIDYLGEAGLGAKEYADYAKNFARGFGWISSGCGRLDLTGKPLSEMDWLRVAYGLDTINIGVVPANSYGKPHSQSAWNMTNARRSWAWEGCDGRKTRVEVYADAHRIKLFLNGRLIGDQPGGKHCKTYFYIRYEPGELKACAYKKDGAMLGEATLRSAGERTMLSAEPESACVRADELCYVRYRYVDENNVLKPLARGRITLRVRGGKLLAFGHACPYNEDGYLHDYTDTYYGEALAIIQPREAMIRLSASSPYGDCETAVSVDA